MKTYSIGGLMIMAACVCASCAYTEIPKDEKLSNQEQSENYREISFSPFFLEVTEDSSFGSISQWKTAGRAVSRAETLPELATTLSYWDYLDNKLMHTDTQKTSSPLEMKLLYGSHNIYFLAHSSTTQNASQEDFTFTPEKVTETFWANFPLEVNNKTAASQIVRLDRVVSKAKITVLDAVLEGVTSMRITVGTHYRTLDLKTGNAAGEPLPYSLSWKLGNEYIGREGLYFYIFTFTPTATRNMKPR